MVEKFLAPVSKSFPPPHKGHCIAASQTAFTALGEGGPMSVWLLRYVSVQPRVGSAGDAFEWGWYSYMKIYEDYM